MSTGEHTDYYEALGVSSTATQQQIRDAYKRAALKTHPDHVTPESPDRAERTRKFQIVNDAYYTLSDKNRRSDYDSARKYYGFDTNESTASTATEKEDDIPNTTTGGFPWSKFGFSSKAKTEEEKSKFESEQFGDIFEEMLKEEGLAEKSGEPTGRFWSILGGISGGAMGFIVANVTGLVAGAIAGNRLGSIRDVKGKSVYAVFQELPATDRTRLLSELAAKVFSHAVGL